MATPNIPKALRQYQQVNTEASAAYASPHRLIQMLMEGAFERIAVAKGCIQRQDFAAKGEQIGKAIDIIGGLRDGLNLDAGGDIAGNLDALYAVSYTHLDVYKRQELQKVVRDAKLGRRWTDSLVRVSYGRMCNSLRRKNGCVM